MNKSYILWLDSKIWCMANPGKKIAIITPEGHFELTFHPKKEKDDGMHDEVKYESRNYD